MLRPPSLRNHPSAAIARRPATISTTSSTVSAVTAQRSNQAATASAPAPGAAAAPGFLAFAWIIGATSQPMRRWRRRPPRPGRPGRRTGSNRAFLLRAGGLGHQSEAPAKTHSSPAIPYATDLLGLEPEGDLAASLTPSPSEPWIEVVLLADREVPADRPRRGGDAVGGAEQVPDHGDRIVAFEDADDDGAAGDEVDQAAEEGALLVLGVVLLAEGAVDLDELQGRDAEPLRLEPREDRADQPALDAIGLEDDQGALHGSESPRGSRRRPETSAGLRVADQGLRAHRRRRLVQHRTAAGSRPRLLSSPPSPSSCGHIRPRFQ